MSDLLSANLKKWRERGDLRYLAHYLKKVIKPKGRYTAKPKGRYTAKQEERYTVKQVQRFFDKDWIPGSYRTPKGHRRIRYTDDTVERVEERVKREKLTNIKIRYHTPEHTYKGTTIPLKGCNKIEDVEKRARKAGLNRQDAKNAAYQLRAPGVASCDLNLVWDYLLVLKGTSQKEVTEKMSILSRVDASYLYEARDAEEFRARSLDAWQRFLFQLEKSAGWDGFPRASQEGQTRRQELRDYLYPFFHQPDRDAFLALYNKESEIDSRILDFERPPLREVEAMALKEPKIIRIQMAALSLKQNEQKTTAVNLARSLGISRAALYRTYKAQEIDAALKLVKRCGEADRATPTEGKKSKWGSM